ncbi:MAG TPA: hypothetical protein DCP40_13165 [Stenotrophomonas sp.]|nr:hypothetical protein [Stenotrophomonas sp.]
MIQTPPLPSAPPPSPPPTSPCPPPPPSPPPPPPPSSIQHTSCGMPLTHPIPQVRAFAVGIYAPLAAEKIKNPQITLA